MTNFLQKNDKIFNNFLIKKIQKNNNLISNKYQFNIKKIQNFVKANTLSPLFISNYFANITI